MNKDELYHAISGINKDFIAESENFESIAANCRKKRIFSKIAVSAVPVCAIAAIGIGLWQNGAFGTDSGLTAAQAPSTDAVPSVTEITAASEQTTALLQTTTVLQTAQQKELYYRDLVKNTDLPQLEGYEMDRFLRENLHIDVWLAPDSEKCVAVGTGKAFEMEQYLETGFEDVTPGFSKRDR